MKIAHISERFVCGGIEALIQDLCVDATRAGMETRVLFLYPEPPGSERTTSIPISGVNMSRQLRLDPAGLARLGAALRRFAPDVLHCHGHYAVLACKILRLVGFNRPIVYTVHAGVVPGLQRSDALVRAAIRGADSVVAVSPEVERSVHDLAGPTAAIRSILNGLDLARLDAPGESRWQVRAEFGIGDDDLAAVTVATLHGHKNHASLFHSLRLARQRLPNLKLLVVGDGPMREELEGLRIELGLEDAIRFAGVRTDVNRMLGASDLFVLPSLSEGMPISIIEACCCGLPVVATRVGGVADLERLDIGIHLVEAGDVEALAGELVRAAPRVLAGARRETIRMRSRELFAIERTAQEYREVYTTVSGGRTRGAA